MAAGLESLGLSDRSPENLSCRRDQHKLIEKLS